MTALLVAAGAILFAGAGPGDAAVTQTGSYTVYSCTQGNGAGAWLPAYNDADPTFATGATCDNLTASLADTSSDLAGGSGAGYEFDPPAGTSIAGYSIDRTATLLLEPPVEGTDPSVFTSGLQQFDGVSWHYDNCSGDACPQPATASGVAYSKLRLGVSCGSLPDCPGGQIDTLSATLTDAQVTIADHVAPVVEVGGTLDSSDDGGVQTVVAGASDVGGGVASLSLSIDNKTPVTSAAGGGCVQPFSEPQPCPSSLTHTFNVDTSGLVPGQHIGRVSATDAAGNTTFSDYIFFTVPQPTGPTGPTGPTDSGSTGGTGSTGGDDPPVQSTSTDNPTIVLTDPLVEAKDSKPVVVTGLLLNGSGAGIEGATLSVSALNLGVYRALATALPDVKSGPGGSFSIPIAPNGAESVVVTYQPKNGGSASATALVRRGLALSARPSKKHIRPDGRLTISGTLAGAGPAAAGAPVEIDAKIGSKWRAVGVVKARASGAYGWTYRFVRVKKPTTFKFRVLVRSSSAWPWPTKTAGTVKVRVAG